jgi:hypothetical protein
MQRLGRDAKTSDVNDLCRRLLTRNMDKWLASGLAVNAATWLKIVHWHPGDRTDSKSALMAAFDYLNTK